MFQVWACFFGVVGVVVVLLLVLLLYLSYSSALLLLLLLFLFLLLVLERLDADKVDLRHAPVHFRLLLNPALLQNLNFGSLSFDRVQQ